MGVYPKQYLHQRVTMSFVLDAPAHYGKSNGSVIAYQGSVWVRHSAMLACRQFLEVLQSR